MTKLKKTKKAKKVIHDRRTALELIKEMIARTPQPKWQGVKR